MSINIKKRQQKEIEFIRKVLSKHKEKTDILSPSTWAQRKRRLPETTAFPGKWNNSRTPYLIEIMDNFLLPNVQEIIIMKSAQVGLTAAYENIICWIIDENPSPSLYITSQKDQAESFGENRLDPAIEQSGIGYKIQPAVKDKANKKTGNTKSEKKFFGGFIKLLGANNPAQLRSISVKNIFFDEVDAYKIQLKDEGSPIALARERTRSFADKKIIYCSTPTTVENSNIYKLYLEGDQRKYFIPCPLCNKFQTLEFNNLKYELKDDYLISDSIYYECSHCKGKILENQKNQFLNKGKWEATIKGYKNKKKISYFINALYSPLGMYSWEDIIEAYLLAKKDYLKMLEFTNLTLGLPTEEAIENIFAEEDIESRIYNYDCVSVPINIIKKFNLGDVAFISMGCDIQKLGIYYEVVLWTTKKIKLIIDAGYLEGETGDKFNKSVWDSLYKLISINYKSDAEDDNRLFPIFTVGIDSGYNTDIVKDFVSYTSNSFKSKIIFSIKGNTPKRFTNAITSKNKTNTYYVANVNYYKTILSRGLMSNPERQTDTLVFPPNYKFFYKGYPKKYIKQYKSEKLVKKKDSSGIYSTWEQVYKHNHMWDCGVYNEVCFDVVKSKLEDNYSRSKTKVQLDNAVFLEKISKFYLEKINS